MRKRIGMAARLIVLALMASLASCQSGRSGGNATSKADITDPNTAFSQGGAETSTANGTTSGVHLVESAFCEGLMQTARFADDGHGFNLVLD